ASGQPIPSTSTRSPTRPATPRTAPPVGDGTGSPASGPIAALIARYQTFSTVRLRIESPLSGQRRLDIVQNRALAAASPFVSPPISGQVRTVLAAVNTQLNTQRTLPGSPQSRRNLMLHLHSLMNRQLLPNLPTNDGQLRSFFLTDNAESGLSNLSVVQMLVATLRASPRQQIRDQIEEILNSQTVGRATMAQILDRTHGSFMPPDTVLAMIASRVTATANRQMRSLTHSVLEICNLALSELQSLQGSLPQP
ncbi:MAG: hypothetical protein ACRC9R_06245, partial [Enterovibrio sp.]